MALIHRACVGLVAAMLAAGGAYAQPAASAGSCNRLPSGAVTAMPEPFGRYMQLTCSDALGQGLKPVDGFAWVAPSGLGIALTSSSAAGRADAHGRRSFPFSWFVQLAPVGLSPREQEARRVMLRRVRLRPRFLDEAALRTAIFLELRERTSNGEEKRVLLIVPDASPGLPEWLVGYECNGACFTQDAQPLAFAGHPT